MSEHLAEVDSSDETKKSWHWYNEDGQLMMTVSIDYRDGHTDSNLEKLIKLHAKGFRIKNLGE
jgi:hypothetical protein